MHDPDLVSIINLSVSESMLQSEVFDFVHVQLRASNFFTIADSSND